MELESRRGGFAFDLRTVELACRGLIAQLDRARSLGATEEELYQAILLNLPLLGFPDTLAAFKIASEHLAAEVLRVS